MSGKQSKTVEEEFIEFNIPEVGPDGKELTKTARKKLLAKAKKDAKRPQQTQQQSKQKGEAVDSSAGNYGTLPLIRSQERTNKKFSRVQTLNASNVGETVRIRARLSALRDQNRFIFLTLRQQSASIQAISMKPNSNQMMNFIRKLSVESIIDVEGTLASPEKGPVTSTTQQEVEIHVSALWLVNSSLPELPIQLEDAERPYPLIAAQKKEIKSIKLEIENLQKKFANAQTDEEKNAIKTEISLLEKKKADAQKYVIIGKATRLDNRVLDLRTLANQAIFRISGGVATLFREFLTKENFVEIHTPKLLGTASEGGADVFRVSYFNGSACLAQSPQLYKQMCISADFDRVWEIGPVFRAEKSQTRRHLTEFIGLDLEMAIYEHYHEVLDLFDALFVFIFDGIKERFAHELEVVRKQYPTPAFEYHRPSLRLKWPEAIALLRENGINWGDLDDFDTPTEVRLGELVKAKYGTDFYMLDRFPLHIRPFYTMPAPDDPVYSNSYDFFMRGQEILSGAQRIHDPELLVQRAIEKEVDPVTLKDYVNSFKYGAYPHGGGGIGLERVVMLYLGVPNIQYTSLFPRTMVRLTP